MIYERQNSGNLERDDLFSKMIEANNSDDVAGAKLDEDEVMGNIYIFLIAGHEVYMHGPPYIRLLTEFFRQLRIACVLRSHSWRYTPRSKKSYTIT